MTYTIEPYSIAYKDVFHHLNRKWLEAYFVVEPVDVKALTDPDGYILNSGGEIWFAVQHGEAVGCYALKHDGDGVFEFTKYAVDPKAQGTGIGRALMDHATERFQARGGTRLYLETNTVLETAMTMYLKNGWTQVEPERVSPYARCNCTMVWSAS